MFMPLYRGIIILFSLHVSSLLKLQWVIVINNFQVKQTYMYTLCSLNYKWISDILHSSVYPLKVLKIVIHYLIKSVNQFGHQSIRFRSTLIDWIYTVLSPLIRVVGISVKQTAYWFIFKTIYKNAVQCFSKLYIFHEYRWQHLIEILETFCWSKQKLMLRIVCTCNWMVVMNQHSGDSMHDINICKIFNSCFLLLFIYYFLFKKCAIRFKLKHCSTSMVKVPTISSFWTHLQVSAKKVLHKWRKRLLLLLMVTYDVVWIM